MMARSKVKHGKSYTHLYGVWSGMVARCHTVTHAYYRLYGSRGISVCAAWRESFVQFEAYVTQLDFFGEAGRSLDRIDNDGNYEPSNVRWATPAEQLRNTSANRLFSLDGKTLCLKDWANEVGISYQSICGRLRRGWSLRDALTIPMYGYGRGKHKVRGPELRSEPTRYRMLEYNGKTQSMADWSRELGLKAPTICYRLKHGWSVSAALSTPLHGVVSRQDKGDASE